MSHRQCKKPQTTAPRSAPAALTSSSQEEAKQKRDPTQRQCKVTQIWATMATMLEEGMAISIRGGSQEPMKATAMRGWGHETVASASSSPKLPTPHHAVPLSVPYVVPYERSRHLLRRSSAMVGWFGSLRCHLDPPPPIILWPKLRLRFV